MEVGGDVPKELMNAAGAATPGTATIGGRTPMYGGAQTPMYGGSATPMHDSCTIYCAIYCLTHYLLVQLVLARLITVQ